MPLPFNAAALSNVKLSKTCSNTTLTTAVTVTATVSTAPAPSLAAINENVRACDIEAWYEDLKDYTYKTTFVELTMEEAKQLYQRCAPDQLTSLAAKLTDAMQAFGSKGAFVKLSSRSPKDATVTGEKTRLIFQRLLSEAVETDDSKCLTPAELSNNAKLIAINRAHIEALCLMDAQEILEVFLKSDRVQEDLSLALTYPDQWRQHFILREWVGVPIELEVRAFVLNGQLNCCCQYYHYLYFPELVRQKEAIQQQILQTWNEVRGKIKLDHYVIDFAVDLNDSKRCYVIELNPFGHYEGMGTSLAMFDKTADADLLFAAPSKPVDGPDRVHTDFEFRIETSASSGSLFKQLGNDWRELFKQENLL